MKKSKGFTLIELVLVMVIASVVCGAFGMLLASLYRFSNRALDRVNNNEDYLYFRIRLESQLRNAKSRFVLNKNLGVDDTSEILALYNEYKSDAFFKGKDGDIPRVSRGFAFYYFDETERRDLRIDYRLNRSTYTEVRVGSETVRAYDLVYSVWYADLALDVDHVSYSTETARFSEVVLSSVTDFMATTHRKPGGTTGGSVGQDIHIVPVIDNGIHAADIVLYVNVSRAVDTTVSYVREITFVNRTVRTPYKIGNGSDSDRKIDYGWGK